MFLTLCREKKRKKPDWKKPLEMQIWAEGGKGRCGHLREFKKIFNIQLSLEWFFFSGTYIYIKRNYVWFYLRGDGKVVITCMKRRVILDLQPQSFRRKARPLVMWAWPRFTTCLATVVRWITALLKWVAWLGIAWPWECGDRPKYESVAKGLKCEKHS